MHIVQIVPELSEGGVERGTVEMNRELVNRGHASTVISSGGRLAPQIVNDGGQHLQFDVCSKNPFTALARARFLKRQLDGIQPDIVHARSRVPAWLVRLANSRRRWNFVTTVHGFNSVNGYSRIMTQGDRVICVSQAVRQFIEQHYPVEPSKIRVIYRGIDLDYFCKENLSQAIANDLRQRLRLQNRRVIATVGRITALKDHATFIRAIALAKRTEPKTLGLIVGSAAKGKATLKAELESLVAELNLEDHIRFAGHVPAMRELYSLCRAVVCTSRKPESFGRTAAEAMAMGCPAIATRLGAHLETIPHGKHGFLVPTESPESIAKRLAMLDALDMRSARDYIQRRFSLDQMVQQTLSTYRELTHSSPQPSSAPHAMSRHSAWVS